MSTYHYCSDGVNVSGALTLNEISTLVARGSIKAETMISMDGGEWISAKEYWPQLAAPKPPPPPKIEQVFLDERGVYVDTKKVVIGNQSFVTRNIGGVAVGVESRSRVFPFLGMCFFGLFAISGLMSSFGSNGTGGAGVFIFIFCLAITIVCARGAFASNLHYITVTASGGAIKVMPTHDAKFLQRVVTAIHQATGAV